jgi:hypothetical protein
MADLHKLATTPEMANFDRTSLSIPNFATIL